MIERFEATQRDRGALAATPVDPEDIVDNFFDYSKVVVKKPWGYEYLIFQNQNVAVWILYLGSGEQSSMHCHPNKKTALVVLEGMVECASLERRIPRNAGEGTMIGKAVFHQTTVTSKNGAFVMEIESSTNKRDLVRLSDAYGRSGEAYETVDKHAFQPNYNYLTLSEPRVSYNVSKRFGNCTLTIKKIKNTTELAELQEGDGSDVCSVLDGRLSDASGAIVLEGGDTLMTRELEHFRDAVFAAPLELLVVKRRDTLMKVSDVVIETLKQLGVREVFFVPGDANVHLVDSLGRDEQLNYTVCQTERVAAMAAEAYAKRTGKFGVLLISSGASGTNALTGVANAWADSVPMLVLSGQAITDQPQELPVRQHGNKSLPTLALVHPITKEVMRLSDARDVPAALKRACQVAMSGRFGPVWVEVPIDLQGMIVDAREFRVVPEPYQGSRPQSHQDHIALVLEALKTAKRPVLLVGNGVRSARAEQELAALLQVLKIPVLTTRKGADLLSEYHPLFFGRPGAYGQRRANFVLQNADLLLSVGARLSIPLTGRNVKSFARAAKKVIVDIDAAELQKGTVRADVAICEDAKKFLSAFTNALEQSTHRSFDQWLEQCTQWAQAFPPQGEGPYTHDQMVNPYLFLASLSDVLPEEATIVVDGGSVLNYTMQTFCFKLQQRLIVSTGIELPGFALPGSIGASVAVGRSPVICVCENRGFQMNIPELQTISDNRLPVKIFVLSSTGPADIRKIQREYFGGRTIGTDTRTPFGSPDVERIAAAYGFATFSIRNGRELTRQIATALAHEGPSLATVALDPDHGLIPRIVLSVNTEGKWGARPLEDMYPFLDREKLRQQMMIDLWDEERA